MRKRVRVEKNTRLGNRLKSAAARYLGLSKIKDFLSRKWQEQMRYQLTWVSEDLAVGNAPMSYEDLTFIKSQGIDAIVNLCQEYCDLHEIEEKSGFEVYYLPVEDEAPPEMAEIEKALAWLDESIYLGKKVMVHCKYGIGRTGTFVISYLLRRGMPLKKASKIMRKTGARPTSHSQWKLLKKYGRQEGILSVREPSLEARTPVDLSFYFSEYEMLIRRVDQAGKKALEGGEYALCGKHTDACCHRNLTLQFIEVVYLTSALNRTLKSDLRLDLIEGARTLHNKIRHLEKSRGKDTAPESDTRENILCPLNRNSRCALFLFRPMACRIYGLPEEQVDITALRSALSRLSASVFFALSGRSQETRPPMFSMAETVSGKYVQFYFDLLANLKKNGEKTK